MCRRGWEWYVQSDFAAWPIHLCDWQGTFNCLAARLELYPRAVPPVEDAHDPRHLSVASTNHASHCRWVSIDQHSFKGCILTSARLPGTPLWLTAVYTDSFASINKWWIPAMW